MRHLLERGVYFTLTVTTSTKQIWRIVCMWSKIENKVCELETNLICTDAKPRDVVHSLVSMSLSPSGSTMLASLASTMSESAMTWKGFGRLLLRSHFTRLVFLG